mmetsp:Transcript_26633/g.50260  ORF Transcript_26633/g.50260 Transcript_26633/m.50260 type:complete len:360 (-) Transcript_26633:58-1137(-)
MDDYKLSFHQEPVKETTYEDIYEIEQKRRTILKQVEWPFLKILTTFHGTCLRSLFYDWLVWVTLLIFVAIRIQARRGGEVPHMVEELGDTDINIIGGFLSFFLVLFVNQTNSRFFDMYKLSKKCAGQIQDVAGLVSSDFPKQDADRLVRYMNAAHIAGYVGLSDVYTKLNLFDKFNEDYKLLNQREFARLRQPDMDSGSGAFKELCTWCQKEVSKAVRAKHIDTMEAHKLHHHILELRGGMDGLYDYCDQPCHYFYVHFLCLLSALYLPIFAVDNAYGCGWGENSDWHVELLNGLLVFLQAIFVVGLRVLGQKMIDPYGDDVEDLSVLTYIYTTLENCQIILSAQAPDESDIPVDQPSA